MNKQVKVYFDLNNNVVIEEESQKIILSQTQAKIALIKLYSMFTDENVGKLFPDLEQTPQAKD